MRHLGATGSPLTSAIWLLRGRLLSAERFYLQLISIDAVEIKKKKKNVVNV